MFVFSSCQNEAVEIQRKVKITISPAKVLESFIPYKSDDLEMAEDEELGIAKLRITALIYDSEGNLYDYKEGLLDDYNSDYSFDILMNSDEEYKLLAFSSSIMGTLDEITYEPYEFHDINNLSTLKVIQANEQSFASNFSVLGVLDWDLVDYIGDQELFLEPATALVYSNWSNIHALHDIVSNSIYGDYSASAVDIDGKTYTWTITLASGKERNEVVINNFSPLLCSQGFTADQGVNSYSGYLSGDMITISAGQETGLVDSEIYKIYLFGLNPSTYDVEDIKIRVDSINKTLTVESMFCLFSEKDEGTIYELFEPGLTFTSSTTKSGSIEFDCYGIIYHNNDIVKYKDNEFVPANVSCKVVEAFDGVEKTSIQVQNTGNIDAYLRVRLVSYWVDADGNIVAKPSSLPEINMATGWIKGANNTYYYTKPVSPAAQTGSLLSSPIILEKDENGYMQVIEVFSEAIQSRPNNAVINSWKVSMDANGNITAVEKYYEEDWTVQGIYRIVTFDGMAAKEMSDTILAQVFNAETFIIGLCSGLIGIGTSLLLLIPGNALIYHLTENPDIVAQLPVENAIVLILLSMVLTLIGGFIPARQAAKKDPVIALRSE